MKLKKKKKAFAFIQSIIILMFIILIINISITMINYNHLKSKTFKSYSDKKSLTIEEEIILKEINKSKNYNFNSNSYQLVKKNDIYYLIKKGTNSNSYFMLEFKDINHERILAPTYYKTENIIGDIKSD